MELQELVNDVRQWGLDRNITGPNGKGTLLGQLTKTQEELTETRDAAVIWDACGQSCDITLDAIMDGVGDCTVTLILAAEMAGLRFEDCLAAAYDEIKGRTGRMENGQFCKDT
jgi:hypothetical protein